MGGPIPCWKTRNTHLLAPPCFNYVRCRLQGQAALPLSTFPSRSATKAASTAACALASTICKLSPDSHLPTASAASYTAAPLVLNSVTTATAPTPLSFYSTSHQGHQAKTRCKVEFLRDDDDDEGKAVLKRYPVSDMSLPSPLSSLSFSPSPLLASSALLRSPSPTLRPPVSQPPASPPIRPPSPPLWPNSLASLNEGSS